MHLLVAIPVWSDEPEMDISKYPEMAPERCAEMPPQELYEKLTGGNSHLPGIGSEAGHDYFCSVYQRQLKKFTDAHYPDAKKYRKEIWSAVARLTNYIEIVFQHTAIKHEAERTGAEAEWMIYQAEKNNYQIAGEWANGSPAELEKYALSFAQKVDTFEEFEDAGLKCLHKVIKHLIRATVEEDHHTRIKFRRSYYSQVLMDWLKAYERED